MPYKQKRMVNFSNISKTADYNNDSIFLLSEWQILLIMRASENTGNQGGSLLTVTAENRY